MVVSIYQPMERGSITVTTDNSGTDGLHLFGRLWHMGVWGNMPVPLVPAEVGQNVREVSHINQRIDTNSDSYCHLGSLYFKGKTLHVRSDNVSAVAAINNQTSSVKEMAHLLRCLAFIAARFQLRIIASHVPGHLNTIADALSRNNIANFFSLVPQADKTLSSIPDELIQLLIPKLPDWTSQHWTGLWTAIFQQDWLPPPAEYTERGSTDT